MLTRRSGSFCGLTNWERVCCRPGGHVVAGAFFFSFIFLALFIFGSDRDPDLDQLRKCDCVFTQFRE